jgi:flagellar hook-basal body complex protein FliE
MSVGGIGSGGGSVSQIIALRQQIIDRSSLLQELHQAKQPGAPAEATAPAGGFADTLKSALDGVNDVQKNASALSEGYERGEVTDIAKVMLARQEAGVAFEATLQVRNKLLSAYQDIMRMGI